MNVTVPIPDALARRLSARGGDLARRAEELAVEELRFGRLTLAELRERLGFRTHAFLKARNVHLDYTLADLDEDQRDLDRRWCLGLKSDWEVR